MTKYRSTPIMLSTSFGRSFAIVTVLLWTPATFGFIPRGIPSIISSPSSSSSSSSSLSSSHYDGRTGHTILPRKTSPIIPQSNRVGLNHDSSCQKILSKKKARHCRRIAATKNHHNTIILASLFLATILGLPSSSSASLSVTNNNNFIIPSPTALKATIISILDILSQSGTIGKITYALSFTLWTMTIGITTPVETAAGMAFPLQTAILLSSIGKIGGALLQYVMAKYLFSSYARRKMKDNEWMDKIGGSFRNHPYGVALIWRFSPLPEFVKNVGPALVPTLRTRYQMGAILTHGLPFTVLWSVMGSEAARVARGGVPSGTLKRMVGVISWVGLVVSPTLFGWWIKGLGGGKEEDVDATT